MSSIVTAARDILAVLRPLTGDPATGTLTVTAADADVTIPIAHHLIPVVGGRISPDLAFKIAEGPNADKSWTATAIGTAISAMSNLGGARHNLADGTQFVFDPPIDGVASVVANGAFSNGTNPTDYATLKDVVIFETLDGDLDLDLRRSAIKAFPAAVVAWQQSEPSDGTSIGNTSRSRTGRTSVTARETFQISVFSSRTETDHHRRAEGMALVDEITKLLIDRHAVDGKPFSNPRGVQIIRRFRESGPQKFYQRFYVYSLLVGVQANIQQTDTRTYNDWLRAVIDVLKPQHPELENQGDYPVVDDAVVYMH